MTVIEAARTSVVPYEDRATRHFPAGRPVLPEWTRHAWASMDEKGWWEPYLCDAVKAWQEIEKWSVVDGVRQAARMDVSPEQLPAFMKWATDHGVVVHILEQVVAGKSYSSATQAYSSGNTMSFRVLLFRPESLSKAMSRLTDETLGELLGYPSCCRTFFAETWGAGQIDTTFDQFCNQPAGSAWLDWPEHQRGPGNDPVEANILWRWMGIRWVPHLPCSFNCAATVAFGKRMREVAIAHGYHEEAKTIDRILSWPVTWSAINGIAEIVGPCLKVSTRTDWSPERRLFTRAGQYQRPEPRQWTNNGFSGPAGMYGSHTPIVRAMSEHMATGARVVDLGCGDGLLLKRLKVRRPDVKIGGVDIKENAIVDARKGLVGSWRAEAIQAGGWIGQSPTAIVLSPERLFEMSEDDRSAVVAILKEIPQVFVYDYADCILKRGPLTEMCRLIGLPQPAMISACAEVQVGLIQGGSR